MPVQLQACKKCGGTGWYDNRNDYDDWSLCWDCIRETMQLPPDVRSGGRGAWRGATAVNHSTASVSVDADPVNTVEPNSLPRIGAGGTPDLQADVSRSGYGSKLPHHSDQYIVERGSGTSGTAYNKRDHEVIDLERKAGNRIVARATRLDAELICRALNAFGR